MTTEEEVFRHLEERPLRREKAMASAYIMQKIREKLRGTEL